MTFFDWLATPAGLALTNAVTVLITAVAAILAFKAKQVATENGKALNGHLEQHMVDAVVSGSEDPAHNP